MIFVCHVGSSRYINLVPRHLKLRINIAVTKKMILEVEFSCQ